MGTSERDIKKYLKVGDNFENVRQLQNYKLVNCNNKLNTFG